MTVPTTANDQQTIEERVSSLERTVEQLVCTKLREPGRDDWRKTIGMFRDDPLMKEIDEEGRKIREADRERARLGLMEDAS